MSVRSPLSASDSSCNPRERAPICGLHHQRSESKRWKWAYICVDSVSDSGVLCGGDFSLMLFVFRAQIFHSIRFFISVDGYSGSRVISSADFEITGLTALTDKWVRSSVGAMAFFVLLSITVVRNRPEKAFFPGLSARANIDMSWFEHEGCIYRTLSTDKIQSLPWKPQWGDPLQRKSAAPDDTMGCSASSSFGSLLAVAAWARASHHLSCSCLCCLVRK